MLARDLLDDPPGFLAIACPVDVPARRSDLLFQLRQVVVEVLNCMQAQLVTSLPQLCPTMANVHLDATEHQDHVVFLHHIQEGPANRSFGLQVARLAGIPAPVLQAAQDKLTELERGALRGATGVTAAGSAPAQSDLFAPARPHPVLDLLRDLEVNEMSPRQALDTLFELQARLD